MMEIFNGFIFFVQFQKKIEALRDMTGVMKNSYSKNILPLQSMQFFKFDFICLINWWKSFRFKKNHSRFEKLEN